MNIKHKLDSFALLVGEDIGKTEFFCNLQVLQTELRSAIGTNTYGQSLKSRQTFSLTEGGSTRESMARQCTTFIIQDQI